MSERILAFDTEEQGLAERFHLGGHERSKIVNDPNVLEAVRTSLQNRLRSASASIDEGRIPIDVDPFSPAHVREPHVFHALRDQIADDGVTGGPLQGVPTDDETLRMLYNATFGWGPAQPYLDDPNTTEVKIVGTTIRVESQGVPERTVAERFSSVDAVLSRVRLTAALLNVRLDQSNPQATLPLGSSTRMHATIYPMIYDAANQPSIQVNIRRGRNDAWVLRDVYQRKSFDETTLALLTLFAEARCSFLIAGTTGSGKTALMEAIINSWAGHPHCVSIEDSVLELNLKPEVVTWTRQLVDRDRDPTSFARAAREALRQTPQIVSPGETRAEEAGAILSLATSDHPTLTTIHAETCAEALERFAGCATMEGSYMYANQSLRAMEDTCRAFHVVIHMGRIGTRRVIREVVLTDGSQRDHAGRMVPLVIPLVAVKLAEDGTITWETHASVIDNMLVWKNPDQKVPRRLAERLGVARIVRLQQRDAPNQIDVETIIARARNYLARQEYDSVWKILTHAWGSKLRDERLVSLGTQALSFQSERHREERTRSTEQVRKIIDHMRALEWDLAHEQFEKTYADFGIRASYTPQGGWNSIADRIAIGQVELEKCRRTIDKVQALIGRNDYQSAWEALDMTHVDHLPRELARAVLQLRVTVAEVLMEQGFIDQFALQGWKMQFKRLEEQ